jgi:hypothetical protein
MEDVEFRKFAESIARMTDESEISGGMTSEDAVSTVNGLIADARKLTGIDPQHMKLFCVDCQVDFADCGCGGEE